MRECFREFPRYGTISCRGKTQLVHRVMFKLLVGEVSEGFQVSHSEPRGPNHTRCCNPHHLEAVTSEEALRRRDRERARLR
ncbi:HNH endonuclease [Streptomyces sp. NPDC050619]|uniref:HNH endonuclease n=1 Tax=Streptomyces sp. NPDC050619 TaxID=3157214 RepID=UPI00343A9906